MGRIWWWLLFGILLCYALHFLIRAEMCPFSCLEPNPCCSSGESSGSRRRGGWGWGLHPCISSGQEIPELGWHRDSGWRGRVVSGPVRVLPQQQPLVCPHLLDELAQDPLDGRVSLQ